MNKAFQKCFIELSKWENIKPVAFKSRNHFYYEVIKVMLNYNLSLCPKIHTIVEFPKELTKEERHRIHLYSIKNETFSISKDKNINRTLELYMSPEHVCKCVQKFN